MRFLNADVAGTICIRLAIFPLVIIGQRNAAEMHNHLPTMQRLQQRMSAERRKGDIQSGSYFTTHIQTINTQTRTWNYQD